MDSEGLRHQQLTIMLKKSLKKTVRWLLPLGFLVVTSGLVAEKKLLLLPIKNTSGNASYNYLEPSITEATARELKKRFQFQSMPESEWKLLAEKNVLLIEESHTKTVALQLGLLGRQDVVIGGQFEVKDGKLSTHIHIADIANKEILKEFTIEGYADSRIWDTVKDIADRVALEARAVLPNKGDFQREGLTVEKRYHRLLFSAGFLPLGFSGSGEIFASETSPEPGDFTPGLSLSLDYMYLNLRPVLAKIWPFNRARGSLLTRMLWVNRAQFGLGWSSWRDGDSSSEVNGGLQQVRLSTGLGYEARLGRSIRLVPSVSAGYALGWYRLEFQGDNARAVDSGGQTLSELNELLYAPTVEIRARLLWPLSHSGYLSAALSQTNFFFRENYNGEFSLSLGGGMAF